MDTLLGMVPINTTGTHQQVAALFAALAAAQAAFDPIAKNQEAVIRPRDAAKMPYTFVYADFAEIIACTRPALTANGLSIVQPLVPRGDGLVLMTILLHAGGATMSSECEAPNRDVADLKEFGGRYNYMRRYQYQGLLCLASEDDIDEDGDEGRGQNGGGDDGNAGGIGGPSPRPSMQRKAQSAGATIDSGSVAWITRKVKALGMDEGLCRAMLDKLQIPFKPWTALTTDQFAQVKSELSKASAMPSHD